jgi:hypothetical protein
VTGGLAALLTALDTGAWVVRDATVHGLAELWTAWATKSPPGALLPATSALDLGLLLLQTTTAALGLAGRHSARGLFATTAAVTLALRAPVIWYALNDSPATPWFAGRPDADMVAAAAWSSAGCLACALVLAALVFVLRPRPDANQVEVSQDGRSALRPAKATALFTALLLGGLNIFYLGRNTELAVEVGPSSWVQVLMGRGVLTSVMGVSSAWQWCVLTILCATGALLAARRLPIALGVTLGLALFMLLPAGVGLWGAHLQGVFSTPAWDGKLVGASQNLLELLGSVAVIALAVHSTMSVRSGESHSDPAVASTVASADSDLRSTTEDDAQELPAVLPG